MTSKREEALALELIHKFKIQFLWRAILFVIFCAACVFLLLDPSFRAKALPLAVLIPIITVVFFFRVFLPYLQDLSVIKNRSFEKGRGKIVRFKTIYRQHRKKAVPVIQDEFSGKEIELAVEIPSEELYNNKKVPSMWVGERYLILYLKHSKAVVYKKELTSYDDE